MNNYKTPQEEFWAGNFGKEYIGRNQGDKLLASNLDFFSKALNKIDKFETCLEFGANIGMNLKALKLLFPEIKSSGIEINKEAAEVLRNEIGSENVYQGSILDINIQKTFDLTLIKGVLIHINPDVLDIVYKKLYNYSNSYILVCEYYNPIPVSINYRGHSDRLYKRDFAGEMIDKFNLHLVDYGFVYRRDVKFPQDDITWFLLKKM